ESEFFMLRTVTQMDNIIEKIKVNNPRKAAIIGGGYIGVETAEALKNCNLDVTVIEALPYILPGFEPETALKIAETMKGAGINIVTGKRAAECIKHDNKQLIKLDDDTEIETDLLIISTGVKPDTGLAETAGIEIGALGGIIVNEKMETSIQDIYAAGDVAEKKNIITGKNCLLPLAVPANKEGRTAGCNAAGGELEFKGVIGTSVVSFEDACVARTSLTYEGARQHGFNPDYIYVENSDHAEYYPNVNFIFLKLIFDKDSGKILGASASGTEGVTRRIDVISTAIYSGLKVTDLEQLELCYSPPHGAAKDIVNISGYVASNEVRRTGYGISPQKFLETHKNKDESIKILDVRTPAEYRQYRHENSENIPLKNLRDSLKNLDKTKVIYVYCAVGFRGYIAAKILRYYGFKAYNILGGLEALKRFKKL
ncbi:MAG: pyridine nucleotide-disulfide oxidoreductase, partial [Flexistipes sinusarabici]